MECKIEDWNPHLKSPRDTARKSHLTDSLFFPCWTRIWNLDQWLKGPFFTSSSSAWSRTSMISWSLKASSGAVSLGRLGTTGNTLVFFYQVAREPKVQAVSTKLDETLVSGNIHGKKEYQTTKQYFHGTNPSIQAADSSGFANSIVE